MAIYKIYSISLLLLASVSFPISLCAQHKLLGELNMFRANDEIIKQQVDYKDPGRSGKDVVWDFSKLNTINDEYTLSYFSFNDTLIIGAEHQTMYNYTLQNDSLLLWGFQRPSTIITNSQPELLLKFPVRYGDKTRSYYYGHGNHGNRLEMDAMGYIETNADAYGMMILPSQD